MQTSVVVTGPNHALHAVLTLLTFWACGGWAWIWLIVAVSNRRRVHVVSHAASAAAVNSYRYPRQDQVRYRLEAVAEVVALRVEVDDHIGFGRDGPVTAETSHTAAHRVS